MAKAATMVTLVVSPLDAYKAMKLADVQTELERRVDEAISDYVVKRSVRRAVGILARGTNINTAERNELQAINTALAVADPIEAAARVAVDRINALTAIPTGDDAFLLQW